MEARFYEPKSKTSKIVAFADVNVKGGITIKGFRIVNGDHGLFAAVPSRPVNVDGDTRYLNQVEFDSDKVREEFLAKLLNDYQLWNRARVVSPAEAIKAT